MGRFFSSSPPLDEQLPPAESIMDGSGSLSEGPVLPRVALPSAGMYLRSLGIRCRGH